MTGFLGLVAGLTITLITGYFAISLMQREMPLRFRLLFAVPMGFSINSIIYFLYLYFNINSFRTFVLIELVVALVLGLFYYNEEKPDLNKHKFKRLSSWFYLLNVYAVLIFLKYFINNPMGSWDGFRIWNIKAEFLSLNTPLWQNVFNMPHFMSHNDYPMMLPSITARFWNYMGGENFLANITLGLFFTFGLVYLLYQAISYFKSEKAAIVVTSVFMILDIFLVNGASQCADIPLAYMYLCAITALFMYFKKQQFSYIVISVVFAALSAWIKNEGMLFFAVFAVTIFAWLLCNKKYKKACLTILIVAVSTVLLALFKKLTHSSNDLVAGFIALKTYNFVFDWSRYLIILKTFAKMIIFKFSLLLVLLLLCVKGFKIKNLNKIPFVLSVIILTMTAIGYFCVYLFSPHDITWLVSNSLDRLILQLLPVFLFLFAINLRIGKPDSVN